jgi:hypothetical protein
MFGSCIIHILYTGCAKIKKNNAGPKRLRNEGEIEYEARVLTKHRNITVQFASARCAVMCVRQLLLCAGDYKPLHG